MTNDENDHGITLPVRRGGRARPHNTRFLPKRAFSAPCAGVHVRPGHQRSQYPRFGRIETPHPDFWLRWCTGGALNQSSRGAFGGPLAHAHKDAGPAPNRRLDTR